MNDEFWKNIVPPTITLIFTSIFGLFVGILIEKFKNRFRILSYKISAQKLVSKSLENIGNNLLLTINNNPVDMKRLKVVTIEIKNNNNYDFDNIIIKINTTNKSQIQGLEAYLDDAKEWIFFSENHKKYADSVFQRFNQLPMDPETKLRDISSEFQKEIDAILSYNEFNIPIFNRKEKAIFNYLILDYSEGESEIIPRIFYKSVKLIREIDEIKQKKKDTWIAFIIGIIITIIAVILISINHSDQAAIILITALIGFSYSIIGYLFYYAYKKLTDFFR